MKRGLEPDTTAEKVLLKYLGRKAVEKEYGEELKARSTTVRDGLSFRRNKRKNKRITSGTISRNNRRGLSGFLIVIAALLPVVIFSCKKDLRPPAVGKPVISKITVKGATVESQIIWNGGSPITECGFCWNTTGNPTFEDFHTEANETEGRFSCTLDTLKEGTMYYIRSYARNRENISYGLVTYFRTEAFRKPGVYSPYIHGVTYNTISCGEGGISYDNTGNIISKGVCWSMSINPTIDDQKIDLGSGSGPIGCTIEGLQPGTVYFFRSYGTNIAGTSYGGNCVARTFDGYMTDFEGHIYYTVRLGSQEWMNRNLETSYYSNGDRIAKTGTQTVNIEQEDKPAYQWAFLGHEDHPELLDDDGRLYTWYTATESRKICPSGWHLPSLDEWNELINHLGGDTLTSRDLRWCFNYHWDSPLNPGNEGSFWAQLAGFRLSTGQFQYGSYYGTYWWTANEASSGIANVVYCGPSDIDIVATAEKNKKDGYSVRCVKNKLAEKEGI